MEMRSEFQAAIDEEARVASAEETLNETDQHREVKDLDRAGVENPQALHRQPDSPPSPSSTSSLDVEGARRKKGSKAKKEKKMIKADSAQRLTTADIKEHFVVNHSPGFSSSGAKSKHLQDLYELDTTGSAFEAAAFRSCASEALTTTAIDARCRNGSFFQTKQPVHVISAVNSCEYNIIRGVVAGVVVTVTSPFTMAYANAQGHDSLVDTSHAAAVGMGMGVVRSVVGGPSLAAAGIITGSHQLAQGLSPAASSAGQGKGMIGFWHHLVSSSYMDLIQNVPPPTFDKDVAEMVRNGDLPSTCLDRNGQEIDYKYEFFATDHNNILEGITSCEYNIVKGVVSGATLLVSAPFKQAYDRSQEVSEFGTPRGWEGAMEGFGGGLVHGVIGGVTVASAGVVEGVSQLVRGMISTGNVTDVVSALDSASSDWGRLMTDPLDSLLLTPPAPLKL